MIPLYKHIIIMKHINIKHIILFTCVFCNAHIKSVTKAKYNVLLIFVDGLRHISNETIYFPNIQRIMKRAVKFNYAYAQLALCTPSRISTFTGRRPDSLRLYDSYSYWTKAVKKFTTLPQLFRKYGYKTYSVGNVFHGNEKFSDFRDYSYAWSEPPYHAPSTKYEDAAVCEVKLQKLKKNLICPVEIAKQPNRTLPDLEILNESIRILKKNRNDTTPFLLAIGFHKPSIPLKFPKKYLEKIPFSKVRLPISTRKPIKMPLVAWHPWMDIRKRDDIERLHIFYPLGVMPKLWTQKIRQSYYAAALFIDDIIGTLDRHVDKRNTIFVLTSDHGFSLGENGLWSKYSNFDVALRVPLIFDIPGIKSKSIDIPVELLDLFPTLTALVGFDNDIPKCKHRDVSNLCFDGKSLLPLIDKQFQSKLYTGQPFAFSQCPRPSVKPWGNTCKPALKEIKIMGYSVRTDRYRYTEWVSFNNTTFERNWSIIYGNELYDHLDDPNETNNVYSDESYTKLARRLSNLLKSVVERGIFSFNYL